MPGATLMPEQESAPAGARRRRRLRHRPTGMAPPHSAARLCKLRTLARKAVGTRGSKEGEDTDLTAPAGYRADPWSGTVPALIRGIQRRGACPAFEGSWLACR